MSIRLSQRVTKLSPSMTLAITAQYKEMAKQGIDVVGFGAGEPDFDTPQHIAEAAIEAIRSGFTRYTAASGIAELKEAICAKLKRDNGLEYQPNQIIIGTGAKQGLFNAIMALCNAGDEVIIPRPYWVSYTEMVKVADADPVFVDAKEENDFKITVKDLESAVTDRTKALIFSSPVNPTGAVYTREEIAAIAEFAVKHDLYVISDEIYEKLIYDGMQHFSIASFGDEIKKRTIVINGMSKAYAMTGWRMGYAAAEPGIIAAMSSLQGHSTSNPTSFVQKAAVAALTGPQEPLAAMVREFERRRNVMVDMLNEIPGISCRKPCGAFYVMANISKLYGREFQGVTVNDSISFAKALLEKAHVAVIPGAAFGADEYIRLSYAASMEDIRKGVSRIAEFVK